MPRFTIAYAPKYQLDKFINLTDSCKTKTHKYCLGIGSMPHVTLCQFNADESDLTEIWDKVTSSIEEHSILINFNKFSKVSFDSTIFWLSLLPTQDKKLLNAFTLVSSIVKPLRNDKYDPHLTLFNYLPERLDISSIVKKEVNIEDEFELILGKSDDIGQLKEILFYSPVITSSKLSF